MNMTATTTTDHTSPATSVGEHEPAKSADPTPEANPVANVSPGVQAGAPGTVGTLVAPKPPIQNDSEQVLASCQLLVGRNDQRNAAVSQPAGLKPDADAVAQTPRIFSSRRPALPSRAPRFPRPRQLPSRTARRITRRACRTRPTRKPTAAIPFVRTLLPRTLFARCERITHA